MTFKKRHNILTVSMLIGACTALLLASFASFAAHCENVQGQVLRLHILANSDSAEDQRLKYELRDFLIEDMERYFSYTENLEQAKKVAEENLPEIEKSAKKFITEQGYEFDVQISLEQIYFTTRVYENITMPAGNYDALRVTIGAGEGQNWWCVIFPPLCLPAASKKGEPYFSAETSKLIENGGKKTEVRFKVYELFKGLMR
ncbi:MAG: stage II sporulation protein R [Oscillospiraceae bacterium]|nr:stage II sporulation protein R [Oscillospiraceae bacterium]